MIAPADRTTTTPRPTSSEARLLMLVRRWLPLALVAAGVVLFAARPDDIGFWGAMCLIGAGASVWFATLLFRLGAQGDAEREDEEEARRYFDERGRWPDEDPRRRD